MFGCGLGVRRLVSCGLASVELGVSAMVYIGAVFKR